VRPLRLGEEKKKIEDRQKPQDENIMVCPIPWGDNKNAAAIVTQNTKKRKQTTTTIT